MPPNQRDPNKKLFSVSIDRIILSQIEEICVKLGITRVDFVRLAVQEKLDRDDTINEQLSE